MDALTKKQLKKRVKYFNRRSLNKANLKQKILIGIVFTIFLLYGVSLISPFFYLISNSFKDFRIDLAAREGYEPNYFALPSKWVFTNYLKVLSGIKVGYVTTSIPIMYINSLTLAVGETIVSMTMTCCAAYILSKYNFKGNKFVYTVVLIASFVPAIAALPAIFAIMRITNLKNTYLGMIILNAGAFGGPFLFIHSYFKQVPWSFAESAQMDGASDLRIFVQIMLPLAKNGIITFTILRFLGFWNDYWYPELFYKNHPTIATGIAAISADTTSYTLPVKAAAMMLAIVPALIFYAIFQKKLLTNTIDGGLK